MILGLKCFVTYQRGIALFIRAVLDVVVDAIYCTNHVTSLSFNVFCQLKYRYYHLL